VKGFTLLWSKILESSIWVTQSKETRLVWITILAMKNYEGQVFASVVGLADRAKVSPDECRKALKVLLSPDPDDTSKVEEGRRIREIQGGWEVINHDFYRFSTEAKREFWRVTKAEQRRRQEMEQDPAFKDAKAAEYRKRRKTGKREMKKAGAISGAVQAIKDGFHEEQSDNHGYVDRVG
jgi:hypothetical protein